MEAHMQAEKECHKWLANVMPGMHRGRVSALYAVVTGALRGGRLNVTSARVLFVCRRRIDQCFVGISQEPSPFCCKSDQLREDGLRGPVREPDPPASMKRTRHLETAIVAGIKP